ncbi:hypothetical protein, partial [Helicobacter bilis]|uniref:hypothetical protein n=1 Tax=Helicobacter bilis TaxID=37372 RepID=UPI00255812FA
MTQTFPSKPYSLPPTNPNKTKTLTSPTFSPPAPNTSLLALRYSIISLILQMALALHFFTIKNLKNTP